MKRKMMIVLTAVLTACVFFTAAGAVSAAEKPVVEAVFCLDTTGSMSGLIEGAKQKIWSISNTIAGGEPRPELRIGLVGYRDYGDEYVTQVFPLTNDLDEVFGSLMSFSAAGGGDTPEHVNRALDDAVKRMEWSDDESTLRLIFLVGDCPPHMDYSDGYDYRVTCTEAVRRGIIVNTVQCGNHGETVRFWKDIARRSEGEYARVEQSGGMETIPTPFDDELSLLNSRLEETVVAFGMEGMEKSARRKKEVAKLAPAIAAERASYMGGADEIGEFDLVDAVNNGTVDLDELSDKELPPSMRRMTDARKKRFLEEKRAERENIREEIKKLTVKRNAYVAGKTAESGNRDSFDGIVCTIIRKQAGEKGISY